MLEKEEEEKGKKSGRKNGKRKKRRRKRRRPEEADATIFLTPSTFEIPFHLGGIRRCA